MTRIWKLDLIVFLTLRSEHRFLTTEIQRHKGGRVVSRDGRWGFRMDLKLRRCLAREVSGEN